MARQRIPTLRWIERLAIAAIVAACMWGGWHMDLEAASRAERYDWGSVPIGGGGYMTGIAIHPAEPDLIYIRTDVGGAYRWDANGERWIPLLDVFGTSHQAYYNVDALAVDPRDPDVVYAAVGRTVGGQSAVLRSTDRGRSWQETNIRVGIYGNADFRWAGPRLAVDPSSGAVLFGTRDRGLWRSDDGVDFYRVDSFPVVGIGSGDVRDGVDAVGLTFVAWDPSSGVDEQGATRRIYVGVYGDERPGATHGGIYVSDDGGAGWSRIPGSPLQPVRVAVDRDGRLFASHTGGVVRCDPARCTEVAPNPGAYSGITVDPNRPGLVMAAERIRTSANPIYLSLDAGASWKRIDVPVRNRTPEPPWWPDSFFSSATSTLTLDPHYPGRVWLTDWFGVWRTDDIFASETIWRSFERGHEEVVVHALTSPPEGSPLISGVADVAGFLHHEGLDRFPTRDDRLPSNRATGGVQDINSIAFYEPDPRHVYMVGNIRSQPVGRAYRSTDYGASWQVIDPVEIATLPDDARGGRIAVSSADPDRIVWLPLAMRPYFSGDGGRTWQPSEGVTSAEIVPDVWNPSVYLTSNASGVETFYIYKPDVGLLRSRDGVRFETLDAGLPRTTARYTFIHAAPGVDGEVWVSMDREGLYRSVDFGETFAKVAAVEQALLFSFGKGRPGTGRPAAYIYGRANGDGVEGVYRSDDLGESWVRISSPDVLFGSGPKVLAGDRQVFGRVYVGTSGRGIFVGQRSPAYAELTLAGAEVRIGAWATEYDVELPFGTDRMPSLLVRLLADELEAAVRAGVGAASGAARDWAPGVAAGSEAAIDIDGAQLRVTHGERVPGMIVVELLDADGAALHRADVRVKAADRPAVHIDLGGRKLPLDVRDTPTLRGEIPLAIEVDGPPAMIRRVEAALVPIRGGDPVPYEREIVYAGGAEGALPGVIEVDTTRFEDGAYDLAITVETVLETSVRVDQRILLKNWVVVEDELLPPQRSGWFGLVKQRKTVEESDGWEDATGDAADFFGDASRLVAASGAQDPYLVWEAEDLERFELTVYANSAGPADSAGFADASAADDLSERLASAVTERIVISVSEDQTEWVDLPFDVTLAQTSPSRQKLQLAGNVPGDQGVRYFRVLLVTDLETVGDAAPLQLGRLVLTLRAH